MDITSIIIWAVVIWIASQIILGVIDGWKMVQLTQTVDVLKHLNDIVHQVKIEKVNDVEYWYDEHDGEFLGQGASKEEVINVLKLRFPAHIFLIEDVGGVAAQTGWKITDPDEFKKINLTVKDI
jgi:hypothetical protein